MSLSNLHEAREAMPAALSQVTNLLTDFPADWCLCGGWGVDAWLGRTNREHKDVDIAVFLDDLAAVLAYFDGWELLAHDALLPDDDVQWTGRRVKLPAHIHARRDEVDLDIQVNERRVRRWWVTRRPQVTVAIDVAIRPSAWDVPVLSPEVILLYKAGDTRPHDTADFQTLLPHLDRRQLTWLRRAIERLQPEHAWLEALNHRLA